MQTRSYLLGQLRPLLFIGLLLLGSSWLASCANPASPSSLSAAPAFVTGSFVGKVTFDRRLYQPGL